MKKSTFLSLFFLCCYFGFSQKKHEDGPFNKYHVNGKLKTEGYYSNNNKIGIWKDYYNSGQLSKIYSYDDKGKSTGLNESYFKNGTLKIKTTKLDEENFITKGYHEDSGILFYEMTLKFKDKSQKYKIQEGSYKEYYQNEALKIQSNYINNQLNGVWTQFYDTGEKAWEINYIDGYKQGVYKQYFKNGKLKLEGSHSANLKNGEEARYNETGGLIWKGVYLENNFNGNWVAYGNTNEKIKTLKYKKGKLKGANEKVDLTPTQIPKGHFEQVPVYPGCESVLGNNKKKKCMSVNVAKFVNENYNTNTASGLGLVGKQRINIIFKISKNGEVTEVRARGPHPKLEKEAIRVVRSLPKMEPGVQRGKAVNVPYSLPIIFMVKNKSTSTKKNPFDDPFFKKRG